MGVFPIFVPSLLCCVLSNSQKQILKSIMVGGKLEFFFTELGFSCLPGVSNDETYDTQTTKKYASDDEIACLKRRISLGSCDEYPGSKDES
jgi:hypothetical protein